MFKFLNNLFGNKKTIDEPIGSAYYNKLKKKNEIKKNKPIKIQNTDTSVDKDLSHENIIVTETSKENYRELLNKELQDMADQELWKVAKILRDLRP